MARRAKQATQDVNAADLMKPLGRIGLRQYSGWVYEEYDPKLRGAQGRRAIRDMIDNSPVVAAAKLAIENVLKGVEWRVVPAGSTNGEEPDPAAQEVADFFTDALFKNMATSWPDFIGEVLSGLWYGWSYHEMILRQRDDGRIDIKDIQPRSQDTLLRWVFADDGSVEAMVQRDPTSGFEFTVPAYKSLHFRFGGEKRNPEGRSMLRAAYRPWWFIKNLEDIEAIGVERDLTGVPVMYVPKEVFAPGNEAKLAAYTKLVRDVRFNAQAGVVLPSEPYRNTAGDPGGVMQYRLELLSSSNSRQVVVAGIVQRHERNIARLLLADFLMLGQEATGSFALSKDKTELFLQSLKAVLQIIQEVVNGRQVKLLAAVNGIPDELVPEVSHDDVARTNIVELAQFLAALAQAGASIFPDPGLEAFLRDKAGLPPPRQDQSEPVALPGLDPQAGIDPALLDQNGTAA